MRLAWIWVKKTLKPKSPQAALSNKALLQFGTTKIDGVPLRFAGAYQQDDTGQVTAYEIYMRGRWQEIDTGKSETGDDTEVKLKARLAYYRLVENGTDLIEIDLMGMIFKVNGVDILEEQRRAIGLA